MYLEVAITFIVASIIASVIAFIIAYIIVGRVTLIKEKHIYNYVFLFYSIVKVTYSLLFF